uniref:Uncharacterized protein n=2 Tax=Anguilla anguilla TaxID=7936 RepID=A0A0E9U989_ANGAN
MFKVLYSDEVRPHPPPMCSIHLGDARQPFWTKLVSDYWKDVVLLVVKLALKTYSKLPVVSAVLYHRWGRLDMAK